MWIATMKLVKNGNASAVSIPRPFLMQLGWLTGRQLVLEMDDAREQLVIRLPRPSDFGAVSPPADLQPARQARR